MPRAILTVLLISAVSTLAFDRRAVVPPGFSSGGPFSPGILVDGTTLYAAGQVGRDAKTKSIPTEFEAEVSAALDNVGAILHEAGMDFKDVVSVQVYLTDIGVVRPHEHGLYEALSGTAPGANDGWRRQTGGDSAN